MATTVVAGRRVVDVRVDRSGSPRSMVVAVALDYKRSWLFDEPGWIDPSFGVAGESIYWWSARHLVVLPNDVHDEPLVVSVDEDIRLVFAVDDSWLLVCETSVRLFAEGHEISRLEFGEALTTAAWNGYRLVLGDFAGNEVEVTISEGALIIRS
jgi:hypothetical protein